MPRPSDPRARERLLSAASQVFVDKGLDRAKVEDITLAAGLSKGAFYLHFTSKEQAFTEILRATLTEVARVATSHFAELEGLFAQDIAPMLRRCLESDVQLFEVIWKHRAIMRLVLLEGGGSVDYVHLTETLVQPMRDQIVAAMELGIARGYYREDLDPKSAASFCSGGFNQLACQMLRLKKKPDLRAELCKLHVYCARAFGTPELIAAAERLYAQSEQAEEQTRVRARPSKSHVRSA